MVERPTPPAARTDFAVEVPDAYATPEERAAQEDRRRRHPVRVTRHYDLEVIPAFDIEGHGTVTLHSKGRKLMLPIAGRDTPEQVGARIGSALRMMETEPLDPAPCGGCPDPAWPSAAGPSKTP